MITPELPDLQYSPANHILLLVKLDLNRYGLVSVILGC